MFKNKKIIASLIVLSVVTATFTISGSQAKASEKYLSNTEVNKVSTLLNKVLSSEQEIMKNGKAKDYSSVINDEKLSEVMQKKVKYKEEWYKDINYKISDYTSNVKINKVNKLTDNKYMLDVTFESELVLSKDSEIHPKASDNYVFEIENKSGQWVINKMIDKVDYQDIIKEKKSNTTDKIESSSMLDDVVTTTDNADILDNNEAILDVNLNNLDTNLNYIDEKVEKYKKVMNKIKNTNENGSEKATPAYSGTNRTEVARYAYKYAKNHNSSYKYYSKDCTNFASQAVYAGGVPQTSYWKPYTAPWINVEKFYSYMSDNGYLSDNDMDNLYTGDVVQFGNGDGYEHSTIVTGFDDTFGVMLSAHSNDRQNYPLANYWSSFSDARDMHFW